MIAFAISDNITKPLPWLLGIGVLLIGAGLGHVAIPPYKHNEHHIFQNAAQQLDKVLQRVQRSTRQAFPLLDKTCPKVGTALREMVSPNTAILSINLIKNNQIYCSSLSETLIPRPVANPLLSASQRLSFLTSSQQSPHRSLLLYRLGNVRNQAAVAAISTDVISPILTNAPQDHELQLIIGPQRLDQHNIIHNIPAPIHNNATQTLWISEKYNYQLLLIHKHIHFLPHNETIQAGLLALGLLIILSSLVFWRIKPSIRRQQPPIMDVANALANHQIIPYFQGVFQCNRHTYIGCEVLTCWLHPAKGLLSQHIFGPLAHKSGHSVMLQQRILESICQALANYQALIPANSWLVLALPVEINPIVLEQCHQLKQASQKSLRIIFILSLAHLQQRALKRHSDILSQLVNAGINLAFTLNQLDPASLKDYHNLGITVLRIPASLITVYDPAAPSLLKTWLDAVQHGDYHFTLQGIEVETIEQHQYFMAHGIEQLQGYFYQRPLPLSVFLKKINESRALNKNKN